MKVLMAGLVGGIVLFAWSAVCHLATPLGEAGISTIKPDREANLIDAMKGSMSERRLYRVPGFDTKDPTGQESEPYKTRNATGPTALIVYNPGPGLTSLAAPMVIELAFNVIECLIAGYIVSCLAPGTWFLKRVLVVTLIGFSASMTVDASYWNWDRFPTEFFGAQVIMNAAGGFFAGLVIAKIVKPRDK
jgi:hypothetical protein